MRVCIYGAGAIGGHLAARLAHAGAEVAIVGRGANLAAIRERGLRLEAPDLTVDVHPTATDDPATLGPQDAVIVAVKAPALASIAPLLPALLRPETPVVFAMNGIPWWYFHAHGGPLDGRRIAALDPGGALWDGVGPQRAAAGVVYAATTVTAPGVVRVENPKSRLILGEPDGSESARLVALARLFEAAGLAAPVSRRVRDDIWTKLLLNLATGPLCTLAGVGQSAIAAVPGVRAAMLRVLQEGEAIARALGRDIRVDAEAIVTGAGKLAHKPSILQDYELGRPMEIDALLTVPLALAGEAGVAAPTLALVAGLLSLRAQAAGLYTPAA
ncbi:ketopantoate reductase family protein [Acidisphaera rubrifaciens]|nr:2-dehydropantoate 2-reductase [Acidisphaera rubrifaciens]